MSQFKRSAFGGYKRAEVDSYVNDLIDQMEQLKSSAIKNHENAKKFEQESEEQKTRLAELETALEEKSGELDAVRAKSEETASALTEQLTALQEKYDSELTEMKSSYETQLSGMEAEYQEKLETAKEKSKSAEERYAAADKVMMLAEQTAQETRQSAKLEASKVIQDAELKASEILSQANLAAERITADAAEQARAMKEQADAAYMERSNAMNEKYQKTRAGIREYIDALNGSEEKLLEVHRSMINLIQQMPLCLDDFGKTKEEPQERTGDNVVSFGDFTGSI